MYISEVKDMNFVLHKTVLSQIHIKHLTLVHLLRNHWWFHTVSGPAFQ